MERQRTPEKPLTGKSFAEVRDIKDRHAPELMRNPIVVGVGIGQEETPESRHLIIKGYLGQKPTQPQQEGLPHVLEEVPVRYDVVGQIVAG